MTAGENAPRGLHPRLDNWAEADTFLTDMFGDRELPDQVVTYAEYENYGRRIGSGDPSAAPELMTRRLRDTALLTLYTMALEKIEPSTDPADVFQFINARMLERVEKHDAKAHSFRNYYNAVRFSTFREAAKAFAKNTVERPLEEARNVVGENSASLIDEVSRLLGKRALWAAFSRLEYREAFIMTAF